MTHSAVIAFKPVAFQTINNCKDATTAQNYCHPAIVVMTIMIVTSA
jgi:hypothetical protein